MRSRNAQLVSSSLLTETGDNLQLRWPQGSNIDKTRTQSHSLRYYFSLSCAESGRIATKLFMCVSIAVKVDNVDAKNLPNSSEATEQAKV